MAAQVSLVHRCIALVNEPRKGERRSKLAKRQLWLGWLQRPLQEKKTREKKSMLNRKNEKKKPEKEKKSMLLSKTLTR